MKRSNIALSMGREVEARSSVGGNRSRNDAGEGALNPASPESFERGRENSRRARKVGRRLHAHPPPLHDKRRRQPERAELRPISSVRPLTASRSAASFSSISAIFSTP